MAEKFSIWTPHLSAGIVGLDLRPGRICVALVFNIFGIEYQKVPLKYIYLTGTRIVRPEYKGRIEEVVGNEAMTSFDQRTGLGTMFGKHEEEDGNYLDEESWIRASLREALEESGNSWDERIIRSIFYKEQPHSWNPYFNVVYLGNAVDFIFDTANIKDINIDKKMSGFYPLDNLPIGLNPNFDNPSEKDQHEELGKRESIIKEVGTYQAAIRRIVAVLLQLRQPTLVELGRPDAENADDLALMVLGQIHYRNLFSQRVMVMLAGIRRMDILVELLKRDRSVIWDRHLARQIIKNLILWLDDEDVDGAMTVFRGQLGGNILQSGAFSWKTDFLGKEITRGSFDEYVAYCKARKDRMDLEIYDKRNDDEFIMPEGRVASAPEDGVYKEEKEEDLLAVAKKQWLAWEKDQKEAVAK